MLNGFEELADDMQKLTDKVTDKEVQKKAFYKGSGPIINLAKQFAPSRTGRLKQSVKAEWSDYQNALRIGIGPPVGTSPNARGFYGRFQHEGFRAVGRMKRSKQRKHTFRRIPGKFYMHKALDDREEQAFKIIIDFLMD